MKFNKLLTIVIAIAVVFAACEKEEEKEPVVKKISVGGLWKTEYLEGDTIHLGYTHLNVKWSNKTTDIYNSNDFAENGIETIPQRGEPIPRNQDSLYFIYKELNFKKGIAINVIEKSVSDYDGNEYGVIEIYDQYWLDKNMATTHYADGTPIPTVIDLDGDGSTLNEWMDLGGNIEAYCYYKDEELNKRYGALYTYRAAMGGDAIKTSQGVCPDGFHVPTIEEWEELLCHDIEGGIVFLLKAKEGWSTNNGKDSFGFSAFPTGMRSYVYGTYKRIFKRSFWWTGSEYVKNYLSGVNIADDNSSLISYGGFHINSALAVRCIRDSE